MDANNLRSHKLYGISDNRDSDEIESILRHTSMNDASDPNDINSKNPTLSQRLKQQN